MPTRTELIADVLMAAAYADSLPPVSAYQNVRQALKDVMGAAYILTAVDGHLKEFDHDKFDLNATLAQIGLGDDTEKRQLLELIAAVHEFDGVIDVGENTFLVEVAQALGMPEEAYDDLALDVIEVARDSLFGPPPAPKVPPPLPDDKK